MNDRANTPTDDPHLPDLYKAVLDDETLDALVRDLTLCATVHQVSARPEMESSRPHDIDAAVQQLRCGAVRALQIRYECEGNLWSDTLMRVGDDIQIVRVNMTHVQDNPM